MEDQIPTAGNQPPPTSRQVTQESAMTFEASALEPTQSTITLPNGFKVNTFPLPPRGFDPLQADNGELAVFGLPGRAMQGLRLIQPTFELAARKSETVPQPKDVFGATSSLLAGVILNAVPPTLHSIISYWTVPNVCLPQGASAGVYSASPWIGLLNELSGLTSVRVGCHCRISHSGERSFQPYWDWGKVVGNLGSGVYILNLDVSPGDVLYCNLQFLDPTSVNVVLVNFTTGLGVHFDVLAPPGADAMNGLYGAWVVEAPQPLDELAPFGFFYFDGAAAELNEPGAHFVDPGTGGPAGPALEVMMINTTGTTIARGVFKTSNLVRVSSEI
jgi:hypothetical protein